MTKGKKPKKKESGDILFKLYGLIKDTNFREIPWIPIWREPQETLRKALDTDPGKNIILLGLLYGLFYAIHQLLYSKQIYILFNPLIFLFIVLLAPIMGVVYTFSLGGVITVVGTILGGKGRWRELITTFAYSQIIFITLTVFEIVVFTLIALMEFVFGPEGSAIIGILGLLLIGVTLIVGLVQFVIYLLLISEAHKFSIWRALITGVCSSLVAALITLIIMGALNIPLPNSPEIQVYSNTTMGHTPVQSDSDWYTIEPGDGVAYPNGTFVIKIVRNTKPYPIQVEEAGLIYWPSESEGLVCRKTTLPTKVVLGPNETFGISGYCDKVEQNYKENAKLMLDLSYRY
jgi:hypothetical protein